MLNSCRKITVLLFVLVTCLVAVSPLSAQEKTVDRTDPVKVANFVLNALHADDYGAIISLMEESRKQEFMPLSEDSLAEAKELFRRDKGKLGKKTKISELRELTTFKGKPGVAAKVRKKGEEVFVIILGRDGNNYYFEDNYTLSSDLYKKLKFIKKVNYEPEPEPEPLP